VTQFCLRPSEVVDGLVGTVRALGIATSQGEVGDSYCCPPVPVDDARPRTPPPEASVPFANKCTGPIVLVSSLCSREEGVDVALRSPASAEHRKERTPTRAHSVGRSGGEEARILQSPHDGPTLDP
jgi:hypothetical protein